MYYIVLTHAHTCCFGHTSTHTHENAHTMDNEVEHTRTHTHARAHTHVSHTHTHTHTRTRTHRGRTGTQCTHTHAHASLTRSAHASLPHRLALHAHCTHALHPHAPACKRTHTHTHGARIHVQTLDLLSKLAHEMVTLWQVCVCGGVMGPVCGGGGGGHFTSLSPCICFLPSLFVPLAHTLWILRRSHGNGRGLPGATTLFLDLFCIRNAGVGGSSWHFYASCTRGVMGAACELRGGVSRVLMTLNTASPQYTRGWV